MQVYEQLFFKNFKKRAKTALKEGVAGFWFVFFAAKEYLCDQRSHGGWLV